VTSCNTIMRNARVWDGSGSEAGNQDIAILAHRICAIGPDLAFRAETAIYARDICLSPGFIDTHAHDDTFAIRDPRMLPKLTQRVATVIAGNPE
jgi:N-acyl-D-amino-acid deacylase